MVPLLSHYVLATLFHGRNAFRHDSYDSHCDISSTPFEVGLLGCLFFFFLVVNLINTFDRGVTIVAHIPLWFAILWKRSEASHDAAARLTVRQGTWAFVVLTSKLLVFIQTDISPMCNTVYISGIIPYCFVTRSSNPVAIFV